MTRPRTRGPYGGQYVGEVVLIVCGGLLLLAAVGLWLPVAVAHPPGYRGGNPVAVAVQLTRGQIRWTLACTLVALAELLALSLLVVAGLAIWNWWARRRTRVDGAAWQMGRGRDLAALSPGGAVAAARRLRPSIAGERRVSPAAAGVLIGHTLVGDVPLIQSWEDNALDIWGPRTGKTTSRAIPAIVDAPGPVLVTSVKGDVVDATRDLRATHGRVWIFDPQSIVSGDEPAWWWNPLAELTTISAARRLASHFASAEREPGDRRDAFFDVAAEELVAGLMLAAAAARQTVLDAYRWAMRPTDDTPVTMLRNAGYDLVAESIAGVQAAPERTRGSVYAMAQKMLISLGEPEVTRWVLPGQDRSTFSVAEFVNSTDALYLLSRGGPGSPAPLVAAVTDAVWRAGERHANTMPGRRLDPPLLSVLDECANIVKIASLPDLFSHYGSRGLPIIAILQSYAQGQGVWGEEGMRTLWSAANIVTYGGGVKDDAWLESLSRLIGEHDVLVRSTTSSESRWEQAVNMQPQRQRILDVADLGALPRGRIVVLASGAPPALVRTCPWQDGPHAAAIQASLQRWDPGHQSGRFFGGMR